MSVPAENVVEALAGEKNSPTTAGEIIRQMLTVRDERRLIAARDKVLVAQWDGLKVQMLALLKEQGTEHTGTSAGTATKTTTKHAKVTDWDKFHAWIRESDSFHLLQRRVAEAAFREMLEAGMDAPPGVEAVDVDDISLRAK